MRSISEAWSAAIAGWIMWNLAKGNSRATAYTRRQHLQRCARSIGVSCPWEVTPEVLCDWFDRQDWANETKRAYRTTLRGFYRWGVEQGHVEESPAVYLPRIQPSKPNPRPAPDSVYLPALAEACERETIMLRLAAEHGMRRAEIAQVHTRDLHEDLAGWSLTVHGKGGKPREVPLLDEVAWMLRRLPPGWAFPGDDNGHLSPRWVGKLVNRLLPGDWTMHKLRHRAATKWWDASGHDTFVVQELLGHASPVTTRLYVAVQNDRLRSTVNRAAKDPPGSLRDRAARRTARAAGAGVTSWGANTPRPTVAEVPNQPSTPNRTMRIPDEIWDEARRIATDRGENVTEVVIRALRRYIREFGEDPDT